MKANNDIETSYIKRFGELPPFLMMMSMKDYRALLSTALKTGKKITDADYEKIQPERGKDGGYLTY